MKFKTRIEKFKQQGEKTGWTYITIPADVAQAINPREKKSYRTKGKIDNYVFSGVSLLPMGKGEFIIPLNANIRKAIGKKAGAMVEVQITVDKSVYQLNKELMECLDEEPEALQFFNTLTGSHQRYFSKWIESAKTDDTKAKRIAQSINSFIRKQGYPEMIRSGRSNEII